MSKPIVDADGAPVIPVSAMRALLARPAFKEALALAGDKPLAPEMLLAAAALQAHSMLRHEQGMQDDADALGRVATWLWKQCAYTPEELRKGLKERTPG